MLLPVPLLSQRFGDYCLKAAEVISNVSRFAAEHRDSVAELDVNPLICAGERITAVDALIAPLPPA